MEGIKEPNTQLFGQEQYNSGIKIGTIGGMMLPKYGKQMEYGSQLILQMGYPMG